MRYNNSVENTSCDMKMPPVLIWLSPAKVAAIVPHFFIINSAGLPTFSTTLPQTGTWAEFASFCWHCQLIGSSNIPDSLAVANLT